MMMVCKQWWDGNRFSGGSITKIIFSAGFVSTNGTSINSNAGRFVDLVKFCETIL